MNQRYQNNQRQNQQQFRFNTNYLKDGYYTDDSKKRIRRDIIIEEADKIANILAQNKMTATTLRRFYNKLRNAYDQYRANGDFQSIVNKIEELQPDAASAVQRKVAPFQFRQFIEANVRLASENEQNLKAFVRHYQSVICYFPENTQR